MLKVFWHFTSYSIFGTHALNTNAHTHIHHKHFAYISGACPQRQWSRVIRRHCCNFLLGLIYFKVFRMHCQLHEMNQLVGKGTLGGREREGMLVLFHFVGEVKNGMRRRRTAYTYTYILYWLVFVLGARPVPMRVIIKHCHHLLNTHSRLATLASYPFIQYECECYSYFIMLFSSKHLTLGALDYWIFIFYTLLFLLMM